jgi:hypothetical protein
VDLNVYSRVQVLLSCLKLILNEVTHISEKLFISVKTNISIFTLRHWSSFNLWVPWVWVEIARLILENTFYNLNRLFFTSFSPFYFSFLWWYLYGQFLLHNFLLNLLQYLN